MTFTEEDLTEEIYIPADQKDKFNYMAPSESNMSQKMFDMQICLGLRTCTTMEDVKSLLEDVRRHERMLALNQSLGSELLEIMDEPKNKVLCLIKFIADTKRLIRLREKEYLIDHEIDNKLYDMAKREHDQALSEYMLFDEEQRAAQGCLTMELWENKVDNLLTRLREESDSAFKKVYDNREAHQEDMKQLRSTLTSAENLLKDCLNEK